MDAYFQKIVDEHCLAAKQFFENNQQKIYDFVDLIEFRLASGGKFLVFGNGGSSSDASHFVGELVGRFEKERKGIPAIALTADSVNLTAIANDYGYDSVFKRQVEALANPRDILLGISTSGKSPNVLSAFESVKDSTMLKVLLTSDKILPIENDIENITNFIFKVPHTRTAVIQEIHIMFLHCLAQIIEDRMT